MTEIKKILPYELDYDDESFRQSTPYEIAEYKAKRLSNFSIADLGAGIGIQSIFFSKYFQKVVAIEKEKKRYKMAERNFKKLNLKNVTLYHGDVFKEDFFDIVSSCEIVFSDPSRPLKGDSWNLEMLSPPPEKIISYFKNNENFSFDIPVQISREKIPSNFELEYISLNGEIKRLSLYLGKIKKYERSALMLPEEIRIVYNGNIDRKLEEVELPLHYIYEIDPAIAYADLIPEFFGMYKNMYIFLNEKKRKLATSDNFYYDKIMKNIYVVNFLAKNFKEVKENLKNNDARKVFLRYSIESREYYKIKNAIEKNLNGENDFYIFKKGEKYIGSIKIKK
ncbi:MAG: rRNA adenine N-6-methyltransferase family protein [Thermoplasmata archaeon]